MGAFLPDLFRRERVLGIAAAVALGTATCHQPEQPPASPPPAPWPTPTNPTSGQIHGRTIAFDPVETIDASIQLDGGSVDARLFQLDTGVSR
jgi:hypothetical protein